MSDEPYIILDSSEEEKFEEEQYEKSSIEDEEMLSFQSSSSNSNGSAVGMKKVPLKISVSSETDPFVGDQLEHDLRQNFEDLCKSLLPKEKKFSSATTQYSQTPKALKRMREVLSQEDKKDTSTSFFPRTLEVHSNIDQKNSQNLAEEINNRLNEILSTLHATSELPDEASGGEVVKYLLSPLNVMVQNDNNLPDKVASNAVVPQKQTVDKMLDEIKRREGVDFSVLYNELCEFRRVEKIKIKESISNFSTEFGRQEMLYRELLRLLQTSLRSARNELFAQSNSENNSANLTLAELQNMSHKLTKLREEMYDHANFFSSLSSDSLRHTNSIDISSRFDKGRAAEMIVGKIEKNKAEFDSRIENLLEQIKSLQKEKEHIEELYNHAKQKFGRVDNTENCAMQMGILAAKEKNDKEKLDKILKNLGWRLISCDSDVIRLESLISQEQISMPITGADDYLKNSKELASKIVEECENVSKIMPSVDSPLKENPLYEESSEQAENLQKLDTNTPYVEDKIEKEDFGEKDQPENNTEKKSTEKDEEFIEETEREKVNEVGPIDSVEEKEPTEFSNIDEDSNAYKSLSDTDDFAKEDTVDHPQDLDANTAEKKAQDAVEPSS